MGNVLDGDFVPQVLFVDDEPALREYATRKLQLFGYEVVTANHWREARELIQSHKVHPEVVLIDPLSKNGKPPTPIKEICSEMGPVPVIVVSALRDAKAVAEAIRSGAREFVTKPFDVEDLQQAILDVLSAGHSEGNQSGRAVRKKDEASGFEFIFESPRMKQIRETAIQIADKSVPVLLQGESGVGKDVVARLIFENAKLSNKVFVKVNCAAMPAELTESELFGYVKGAFTGAYIDRPGKFEFAHGGTIFLDEIGEFPPSVQAKLLQVLQDGKFTRLGSNQEIQVDVRVIAATNCKLEEAIEKGNFREDLYYRLNVVSIEVPPLRQRKEEIPLFCEYFVKKFADEYQSNVEDIPEDLMSLFSAYSWPGNVRQLENIVKRYIVLQDVESIRNELESRISRQSFDEIDDITETYLQANENNLDLKEISKQAAFMVEKNMIIKTLQRTNWNKWKAAKELKVSYKTLLTKIDQYGIKPNYR